MKKFAAVVYTAGRTGSHLIIKNLCKYYNVTSHLDTTVTGIIDGVVHTHNPMYNPPTDDFIAIISRRRNLFESILSTELAKVTNEFTQYTDKELTPYAIDIVKFKNCYFYQKAFYQAIDQTCFTKIVDVYYEDLITNPDCLLADLNIKIDTSLSKRSPYDYYNLITNIDELKEEYQKLEQTPITTEELEKFKNSVQADLEDIRVKYKGNRP